MMLKNREIEIIQGAPFTNDALNRKDSAEALTLFVTSSNVPMVICIDAPWGQGKTTFLRMWEQHLKDMNIPTIYFSAWENDFTDDGLVSLIGEIGASIDEISKNGNQRKAHEYLEKAKKLGIGLLKRSVPVAAKIATAGALDLDDVTEEALGTFAEYIAKEQMEKYEQSKKTLQAFRDNLSKLANSISTEDDHKPLIFIIDELDRCRPTYSIEVLEKAKHFFNVENIVFVLGADKVQLGHSIKAVYGNGINVDGYLRRFIDFDYVLPTPTKGLFVKSLFNQYSFHEYFSSKVEHRIAHEGGQALSMFTELFEIFDLTLREQQHCCSLLSLAIRTTPTNYNLYPIFLCFLIVLKVKDSPTYKKFINEEFQPTDILNYLSNKNGMKDFLDKNYGIALEAYIISSKSFHGIVSDDLISEYKSIIGSNETNESEKERAQKVMEWLKEFGWNGGLGVLGYLVNKIEIASRFKS